MDRSWLSVQGHMQALNNQVCLKKLRETGNQHWFVVEDNSSVLYYNQNSRDNLPKVQPEGSLDISSGKLEVFVVLTSNDGKEYLLSPGQDDSISEWLVRLKNKTALEDKTVSPLQRDTSNQGGFMSRVRSSLRRKKKITRSASEDVQPDKLQLTKRPSYSSNFTEDSFSELSDFKNSAHQSFNIKSKRSQSVPNEFANAFNSQLDFSLEISEGFKDQCCDTSSLASLEKPHMYNDMTDQSTQTATNAEDSLKDALIMLARQMPSCDEEAKEESIDQSVYSNGVMTLQQQKLIRELEMEVCKLKCEVVNLIQGTINIPLKDDDLADWHYVEEIRYKDRIFELLREARLYNPSLPNYDSSTCSNFKDEYGFIHGSRESESVVFHYVCRELTQHFSSFFQNKTGHVKLWTEYSKAKEDNDEKILFQEKEIKGLVQEGIPSSCRSQVWKCFIQENSKGKHVQIPNLYSKLVKKTDVKKNKLKSEMTEVERQIRCDLLRTMPSNKDFKTLESLGVQKLSRILHAFADYKPEIGYLQGMNFLVGLFLLFMDEEEDAFWSLCAVVECYLDNYFDQVLSGAQADQEVLKDLIAETMPALHAHLKYYGVDISTVTFNWFITVYLDAVPFETAVRIWDCFLFSGREVLFRIAIGLLKLQQRSLLQLSGYLEIMQYMKRAARVTYDIDRLFKASFEEITKFPSNDKLDELQRKYRSDIEAKNDHRMNVKHERKRSRVSSFNVEIAAPDRSDRLDYVQVVECAVAASKDLSKPVCIPCSVRGETKLYLLDIEKKERSTLHSTIDSRVLCADVMVNGTLLIGTVSWHLYAFSLDYCEEIWSIQLNDSVVDLCHYEDKTEGKVYAALADGSIAVLPNANFDGPPSEGSHVRIGSAPVMCVILVEDKVWCGCSNNVVILDSSTLEEVHAMDVSTSTRHQVARLNSGEDGVWCTIRGSSWVILIDKDDFDVLLKVDVSFDTTIIDAVSKEMQVTVSPFHESRITTVLPFGKELWVGLGNGQVLIFDIVELPEQSKETTHTLDIDIENNDNLEKVGLDKRFSIKMRVQYRVSEEPIRSLIVLRETDGPVVLSCAGTLSLEGGISLWEKENYQEDLEEWLPCPVRHMIRNDSRGGPVTPPSMTVSPSY